MENINDVVNSVGCGRQLSEYDVAKQKEMSQKVLEYWPDYGFDDCMDCKTMIVKINDKYYVVVNDGGRYNVHDKDTLAPLDEEKEFGENFSVREYVEKTNHYLYQGEETIVHRYHCYNCPFLHDCEMMTEAISQWENFLEEHKEK